MATPTLEGLPIELRIPVLLNAPDLDSLRSLVHSSPSYHQAYRLVRQEALQNILHRQYDGLVDIAEAIAAVRSNRLHASIPSNREEIIALLDAKRRSQEIRRLGLLPKTKSFPDQPFDVDEILELLRLHRIAVFLLDDYCHNAPCPEWMDPDRWSTEILPLSLSRTEKVRYFRAFYRLQTHGNIFGARERFPDSEHGDWDRNWDKVFSLEEAWGVFFGPLPPWEVEEFGCLWKIFHDRNAAPYDEIANDLIQYGRQPLSVLPKHLRVLESCMVLDCDDLKLNDIFVRETLASLGPAFLFKLLREKDYLTRRNILLANAYGFPGLSFPECSPRDPTAQLPLLYPADRFNRFGTDMNGLREFLATLPDIERPNLGWERVWLTDILMGDKLFAEMFECGLDPDRCSWGYALWDSERLIEWNAPLEPHM